MDSQTQDAADTARPRANGRSSKSAGAFRTISEVADELDVAQHVLRFWESKFPQVRPLKRGGGRRYYRPEDVDLLRRIRSLLYEEGYTIKGAQKLLKGQRRPSVGRDPDDQGAADAALNGHRKNAEAALPPEDEVERMPLEPALRQSLCEMRDELVELRDLLQKLMR
jgi:DNA-binding transcriptional MerR regulator